MAKNHEKAPLNTQEDVEAEAQRRIKSQREFFPDEMTPEREQQIKDEVQELFDATTHAAERQADMEVWKARAAEDIPFLESFDEAVQFFGGEENLEAIDDYVKLDDKHQLIDVAFIGVKFWFSPGEIVDETTGEVTETIYATLQLITIDSRKFTITDGSTGIRKQLQQWYKRTGKYGGIPARNGLRVSQYPNPTNRKLIAETFYLT